MGREAEGFTNTEELCDWIARIIAAANRGDELEEDGWDCEPSSRSKSYSQILDAAVMAISYLRVPPRRYGGNRLDCVDPRRLTVTPRLFATTSPPCQTQIIPTDSNLHLSCICSTIDERSLHGPDSWLCGRNRVEPWFQHLLDGLLDGENVPGSRNVDCENLVWSVAEYPAFECDLRAGHGGAVEAPLITCDIVLKFPSAMENTAQGTIEEFQFQQVVWN